MADRLSEAVRQVQVAGKVCMVRVIVSSGFEVELVPTDGPEPPDERYYTVRVREAAPSVMERLREARLEFLRGHLRGPDFLVLPHADMLRLVGELEAAGLELLAPSMDTEEIRHLFAEGGITLEGCTLQLGAGYGAGCYTGKEVVR